MVKKLPANAVDVDLIPAQEYPLQKKTATYSSILPRKSHEQRSLVGYSSWGHERIRYD